ncbi:hypothetical protein A2303_06570 [Candidatus Falkowbacteria bacterium RIFOXYB2_FULL_47_14]|uniref:DUF4412 domain-containing protein n=1 Tax=Candidatus Falkowbacteria bacterium RIFOXYA2_FULL_47_19 TaxID=1797994 RepID=A0A1F5SJN8_9BACT|nr:MAG: hypothetical protein A2227_06265 [Candidatus Falkowbacteria bacterium RIFOXYA2_FULL_47_19]OGF35915.1 MAG: hypothetical protein A2468_01720 [Candidatus Falkowbacteria bacterium RIFOXYC2_FULL_46_15]OGF42818.1 MAG: hypothetical protein A2303_06570 [Candidatus Falkowbacteria bacterium RIFOXYB2_FULL_47_14]
MKKIIILTLALSFCLAGTGCAKKKQPEAALPENKNQSGLTVIADDTLTGWLKRGRSVECSLSSPEGEIKISAKNDKIRIDGITYAPMDAPNEPVKNGVSLTDGDMTYMWGGGKGTKFSLKKMQELSGELDGIQEQRSWEDTASEWESAGLGYNCREADLSDGLFTPPADVVFQDLNEFMEGLANISKELEKAMGNGQFDMETPAIEGLE